MSNDKNSLNEGMIKDFLDKIFYKIVNGLNDKVIQKIRRDPELDRKISEFRRSQDELMDALDDLAKNPEKYMEKGSSDSRNRGSTSSKSPSSSSKSFNDDRDDHDDDTPDFIKKMMD